MGQPEAVFTEIQELKETENQFVFKTLQPGKAFVTSVGLSSRDFRLQVESETTIF